MEQRSTSFSNDNFVTASALPRSDMILDLGLTDYRQTHQFQLGLNLSVSLNKSSEAIIITEHFSVYTCGRTTKKEDKPLGGEIPIVEVERGGELTYHGPGQIVGYPILNLAKRKRSIPQYLRRLEEVLIKALQGVGVEGARTRPEYLAGVWIGDKKIVSIGIALKRWVTYHGFALNVDCDLGPFKNAKPCGMTGDHVSSLKELGYNIPKERVCEEIKKELLMAFF